MQLEKTEEGAEIIREEPHCKTISMELFLKILFKNIFQMKYDCKLVFLCLFLCKKTMEKRKEKELEGEKLDWRIERENVRIYDGKCGILSLRKEYILIIEKIIFHPLQKETREN